MATKTYKQGVTNEMQDAFAMKYGIAYLLEDTRDFNRPTVLTSEEKTVDEYKRDGYKLRGFIRAADFGY